MINICIYCNPNYNNNLKCHARGATTKNLDIVSQAIILCNSINKNWKSFDYQITLFYNKNILWSKEDWKRISRLKFVDKIPVSRGDHPDLPWQCRIPCFNYPLKNKGTHRLVLDCDMVAIEEPTFDLNCDWQGMFSVSGNLPHTIGNAVGYSNYKNCNGKCFPEQIEDLNKIKLFLEKNNFNLSESCIRYEKQNLQRCHLHTEYHRHKNLDYKKLYPHFNFGAILLKENLCCEFADKYKLAYRITEIGLLPHCGMEYVGTYILKTLSDNWKPFKQGFNIMTPLFTREQLKTFFEKKEISLIHYPGTYALVDMKTPNFEFMDTEYEKVYNKSMLDYLNKKYKLYYINEIKKKKS